MRLLLDTHALLWWLADDPRLAASARGLVADRANTVLVSVVSIWEIVVKVRIDRLVADLDEVLAEIRAAEFRLLPIKEAHLKALRGLPIHHRDPFDHLLIAQAIAEDTDFLSADARVPSYPVRHMACSAPAPLG